MAIWEIKQQNGAVTPIAHGKVNATNAVVKMEPIFKTTGTGLMDICSTGAGLAKIMGIAAHAAAVNAVIDYFEVDKDTLLLVDFTKTAYTIADLGKFYGGTVTSGVLTIDMDVTNADAFQVVSIESINTALTAGKCWVKVITTVNQNQIEVA